MGVGRPGPKGPVGPSRPPAGGPRALAPTVLGAAVLFVTGPGLFACFPGENFNLCDVRFLFLSLRASGFYILLRKDLPM